MVTTHHYIQPEALCKCTNIRPATGHTVTIANGRTISPQFQGSLSLSSILSPTSQHAYAFDDLQTWSLLFLVQLCDEEGIATLSRYNLCIVKDNKVIITGRQKDNGLWKVPLIPHRPQILPPNSTPPTKRPPGNRPPSPRLTDITYNNRGYDEKKPQASSVIRLDQIKVELAQYLSAACFNPFKPTLLCAIKQNHLASFPGLTTSLITKLLPKNLASSKGHLDKKFKTLRSTKDNPDIPPIYD